MKNSQSSSQKIIDIHLTTSCVEGVLVLGVGADVEPAICRLMKLVSKFAQATEEVKVDRKISLSNDL